MKIKNFVKIFKKVGNFGNLSALINSRRQKTSFNLKGGVKEIYEAMG